MQKQTPIDKEGARAHWASNTAAQPELEPLESPLYVLHTNYQLLLALLLAHRDAGNTPATIIVPEATHTKNCLLLEMVRRMGDDLHWARFDAKLSAALSLGFRMYSSKMLRKTLRWLMLKPTRAKILATHPEFLRHRFIIALDKLGRYMLELFPEINAEGLENGAVNYYHVKRKRKRKRNTIEFSPRISCLHVTRPHLFPLEMHREKHIDKIDISAELKKLSRQETRALGRIMCFNKLPVVKNRAALILTQPLFRKGLKDTEAIHLYLRLARDHLSTGLEIYLKPHPADRINWHEAARDFIVFPREFPLEILEVLSPGTCFAEGLALHSTALDNCPFIQRKMQILPDNGSINEKILRRLASNQAI